ncbi:MAG: serine hydrolase domain-containing protein, partial [Terriglobales bacterium]
MTSICAGGPHGRLEAVRTASLLILVFTGSLAHAAGGNVEERIRSITTEIPPAIILEGEPRKPVTLADRMGALHVPGVSIAVIHHGTLEWARGFGVVKLGGAPVTPETLFQAASISKPITALAVLNLVDGGKIKLDANANEYLRSWKLPENEFTAREKVTVRELLSHTAGVTVGGFGGYYAGEPLPTLRQILDGQPPANNAPIRVDTVPDTAWRYSGGGYVILRQLLEDVTGLPFASLLQESVLAPIGMTRSTLQQPTSAVALATAVALAAAAVPHDREGRPVSGGPKFYPELAPDGLWTTPSDLARYVMAVQGSLAGKRGSLLSAATAHLMLTARLTPYGLGVIVGDDVQHPWFTHNGGNYGYSCVFVAYNQDDGAVVMANGENGYQLEVDILRSIAHEYNWPDFQPIRHHVVPVEAQMLARYVGAYQLSKERFAAVLKEGRGLAFQATDQGRQPVFPLASNEFVLKQPSVNGLLNRDEETKIRFESDGDAPATGMSVVGSGTGTGPAR